MTLEPDELARLRDRAVRALAQTDFDELFSRWRAVVGPPPKQMSRLANAAFDAIRNLETPKPEELQALEYAIRLLRPAPLVISGRLNALSSDTAAAFPDWEAFRDAVAPYLGSVGRIDRPPLRKGTDPTPVGTGFLIGKSCLVTNRHVVDALTLGTGALVRGQAQVRFGQEHGDAPDPAPVPVLGVLAAHPDLDLAVLRIEADDRTPIPLTGGVAQITPGATVAAIGYPVDDPRNEAWVNGLFEGTYQVKRAAPGEVTGLRGDVLFHDCTTLGGNSGSPILTQDGARLAGVHADGMFLARNHALCGPATLAFLAETAKTAS